MITGISGFGLFCPKMAASRRTSAFLKNKPAETLFLWCFLGARFLGQGAKERKFWTPTKKGKN